MSNLYFIFQKKMNKAMLKDGSKYIKFINRRLFRPVLLKTFSLMIVLIFFTMLSLQIEEIKGKLSFYNVVTLLLGY